MGWQAGGAIPQGTIKVGVSPSLLKPGKELRNVSQTRSAGPDWGLEGHRGISRSVLFSSRPGNPEHEATGTPSALETTAVLVRPLAIQGLQAQVQNQTQGWETPTFGPAQDPA